MFHSTGMGNRTLHDRQPNKAAPRLAVAMSPRRPLAGAHDCVESAEEGLITPAAGRSRGRSLLDVDMASREEWPSRTRRQTWRRGQPERRQLGTGPRTCPRPAQPNSSAVVVRKPQRPARAAGALPRSAAIRPRMTCKHRSSSRCPTQDSHRRRPPQRYACLTAVRLADEGAV